MQSEVNKAKSLWWKKSETNSLIKKNLPQVLTILDTVVLTLQGVDKNVKISVISSELLKTISILYTFDEDVPTWKKFIEIDVLDGTARSVNNDI